MRATTRDAYELFHDGAIALARVEENGMCIDVERLGSSIRKTEQKIKELEHRAKKTKGWAAWKRRFGSKASMGSRLQLGVVLFEEMGFEPVKNKDGKIQVDEKQLERIDSDLARLFVNIEKLKKLKTTYLEGISREVVDGLLHPFFNLHLVETYRSSSDSPNFQNIPIRDAKMGKIIRSCFVPRPGHALVEIDYGALEFRVCACFWRDDSMVAYASDPSLDIHRDMAAELYCVPRDGVTKEMRFYAKNSFVFATLYGSYYKSTSRSLWQAMESSSMVDADGRSVKKILSRKSIDKHNYPDHVQRVEEKLQARFPQWTKRKEEWWSKYLRTGRFRMLTGFELEGVYSRNNLMNTPIQGPAFHILLWSLIRMVKWCAKRRTKIVGQIHDSIVADVHLSELDEYLAVAKQVMTKDVRDHWSWIVTPLEIEAEVAHDNWFNKKVIEV